MERQFYLSPRGQRVAFLFLANDIVQNNQLNGLEFVNEFWKVIRNALKDVVQNGGWDDKKEALRLVNIWEERRVFGSRLHFLKRELSDLLAALLRYKQIEQLRTWEMANKEIDQVSLQREYTPEPFVGTTSAFATYEEQHKPSASDVSPPSAHSLTNVHSSTAAEGVIGQSMSRDYPSDSNKRPRVDSDGPYSVHCYSPHPPSYPYPEPPPPLLFDDEVPVRASQ